MASNLGNELKNAAQGIVGNVQLIIHSLLVVIGLILLVQDLGWLPAAFRFIPGSFQQWIYAAGFAYLIRR